MQPTWSEDMRKALILVPALMLALALCACGGTAPGDFGGGGDDLGELDFFLSTPPESSVQSNEVDGELLEEDDALNAREASSLPGGFIFRQGMHFTPLRGPGEGFVGRLDVRMSQDSPATDEYEGVLLYLFYVDPVSHACTQVDSSRGRRGNRVTFDLDVLGFFVIAENSSVPRPGDQFTVSAFADQALAQVGTTINFWAVPQNGSEPISYKWTFGDGGSADGETVSHAYNEAGTYNIGLTATDAQGRVAPASSTPITITTTPNPLQGVTVSAIQNSNEPLVFSLGATVTGGEAPFSYAWDFSNDGSVDSTAAPPFDTQLPDFGVFELELTVTDSNGDSVSGTTIMDARVLDLTLSPTEGAAPLSVQITLDARGFDPGDVISIDMGNGDVLTAPQTAYVYAAPGEFTAQASGSTTFNGTPLPRSSDEIPVVVTPASTDSLPFIQLTQPIQPAPDSSFTIHGFRFGASQDNRSVMLGATELTVESWSENTITIQQPATALSDGSLQITSPAGNSNSIQLNVLEPGLPNLPSIQNVLPQHAVAGGRVLVIGNGLDQCDGSGDLNGSALTLPGIDDACFDLLLPTSASSGAATLSLGLNSGGQLSFGLEIVSTADAAPVLDPFDNAAIDLSSPDFIFSLRGSLLGDGPGDLVLADGYVWPTLSWSATEIGLQKPTRNLQGKVVVIREEDVSNSRDIVAVFPPVIDSLGSDDSWEGQPLVISGQNFLAQQGSSIVFLSIPSASQGPPTELPLPVQSWSDNSITVTIPVGANDGQVFVQTYFRSNGVDLNIIPPPPGTPGGGQL
ncbi:PKD domain-containing protein [bacterium]|nr:PKD domain-containing protein [bacterium]